MSDIQYPQSFESFVTAVQTRGTNIEYFQHFNADQLKELESGKPLKKKYFKIRARQLVLKGNNLSDEGAAVICMLLKKNTFLQVLGINSNKIGLAGAESIADALKENRCLKTLSLQHNRLDDAAIEALAGVLHHHDSIHHVSFNGNKYSINGHKRLLQLNEENEGLTIIGKNNIEISEDHAAGLIVQTITSAVSVEALETEVGKILEKMELSSFAERFYDEQIHTKEQAIRLGIEDYNQLGIKSDIRLRLEQAFNKGAE